MTSLICFVAVSLLGGGAPLQSDMNEGKAVFLHKKGIDRTQKDARVVIGQWFDGDRKQTVEEAVFITPGLLGRWLGYMQAAGTSQEAVDKYWADCSSMFAGKTTVIVRLARLSAIDMIDGDLDNSAKPDALDNVQLFLHTVGSPWQAVKYRAVQDILQRRPEEVLKETWDQLLPKFTPWPGKATENDLNPEVRWGLNRRVSYLAEIDKLPAGSKCELKIVEKDRTRVIPFIYPKS